MTRLLLITLLLLSSVPAYAEWVSVSSSDGLGGYTAYLDPDTIHRKGQRVKMWVLYDFKTIQTVAGNSHLSLKVQDEYDCTEGRTRGLAVTFFSGSMGMGNVVRTDPDESNWSPIEPESIAQDLWKVACGKGQSSGRAPASPAIKTSFENLQTLRTQAAQGDAKAQYNLGVMYAHGDGVTQDYVKARVWYEKAAVQGLAQAQSNLGVFYAKGQGVPQDYAMARQWYEKAAAQGIVEAQFNLGILYADGQGVPQDYAKARQWYEKAAVQGDAQAQSRLGVLYDNGWSVPQDYAMAWQWYEKAAVQGIAQAQNNLGSLYEKGQGVPQDYVKARVWYEKAAVQGHAQAQSNLGALYANGQGVSQDYTKARGWYGKAAAQGNAMAQYNLGALYANGQGVPQDYVRASMWLNLAAAFMTGDEQKLAVDNRDKAARSMTPAQIAEANRLSQQCQAQNFKGC